MRALLAVLALTAAGCEVKLRGETTSAPQPSTPSRFVVHASEYRGWDEVAAICDSHTGNLLYIVRGPERAGIAVVPGGCAAEAR